jgi:hypothetical protein
MIIIVIHVGVVVAVVVVIEIQADQVRIFNVGFSHSFVSFFTF